MKKLAIIYHNISLNGGTEKYWYYLAKKLSSKMDISAFSNTIDNTLLDKIKFNKVYTIKKPSLLTFLASFFLNSTKLLWKNKTFDVIHCSGPDTIKPDICTSHVCQRARLESTKGLLRLGLNPKSILRELHFHLLLEITAFCEKRIYKRKSTKKIICVSEKVRDELIVNYGINEDKLVVIPCGINEKTITADDRKNTQSDTRKELKILDNEKLLLFVSSDWRRKGLETIYNALSDSSKKEIKLLVVGNSGGDKSYFEKLSKKLNIADQIIKIPFTNTLDRYYLAADILVHPSYYDSFGLVPLEAMSFGLPVIMSKQTGLSGWIKDEAFTLDDPNDHQGLLMMIEEIIDTPELKKTLSSKASKFAKDFTWDKIVEETAKVYEEVIELKDING